MTIVPDLTLADIHAKCKTPRIAEYIASMAPLPPNTNVCEFLAVFLQAASVAQIAANVDAKVGEKLNAYPLPVTGNVLTDSVNNIQHFKSTHTLNVVTVLDTKRIVPAYV
jgi:hypothetical protein